MDGWMDGWMDEWMDGWANGRIYELMDGWMDGWMGEWTMDGFDNGWGLDIGRKETRVCARGRRPTYLLPEEQAAEASRQQC